jgi:DNA-binding MarR family transcriptional regulator
MKEIVERIKRTKSTVSDIINRLEAEGFVEKHNCDKDQRQTYVKLTLAGANKAKLYEHEISQLEKVIFSEISQDERWFMFKLSERLSANIDKISSGTN